MSSQTIGMIFSNFRGGKPTSEAENQTISSNADGIDQLLNDLGNFLLSLPEMYNNFIKSIVEGVGGVLYNVLFQWMFPPMGVYADVGKLIAYIISIELLNSVLDVFADWIGGDSGDERANKPIFPIPLISVVKYGHVEIIVDSIMTSLSLMQINIGDQIELKLNNEGKTSLVQKLSFLWNTGWIVGLNSLGEILEDIGKMFSKRGKDPSSIVDNSNLVANGFEYVAELIRMMGNVYYLGSFLPIIFDNELGFTLSLADIVFGVGWLSFLAQTGLLFFENLYGMVDNIDNMITKTYSGKDLPKFLLNRPLKYVIPGAIFLSSALGATVGYALSI